MDQHAGTVDIFDVEVDTFGKPESEGVDGKQAGPVSEFVQGGQDMVDFFKGQDIRKFFDLGGPDNVRLMPLFFEDSFPEKAQTPAVHPDYAP